MRIRRNASRILGLASCLPWLTSPEPRANDPSPPLGELCQLNRSPWDVSPSPSEEARDPDPPFLKVEDSIRQEDHSVALSVPMSGEEEKKGKKRRKNAKKKKKKVTVETIPMKEEPEKREEEMTIASAMKRCRKTCNKSDGKGWRCKKPAQVPHSLCRYHLAQLRAYNAAYRAPVTGAAARGRKRRTSTRDTGSDFYYYSGFGPWRGKKRSSGDNVEVAKKENVEEDEDDDDDEDVYDNDNDDHDNDEDDDGEQEVEVGVGSRKRGRKKIKARSLKSLL